MKASVLKVGAVVSALALGGTYVVIQQRSGAKQVDASSPPANPAKKEITLMVGSKSPGGDFRIPLPNSEDSEEIPPVLMPSSKVIVMPVFRTRTVGGIDSEDPPTGLPDAIMSSSKSGAIQLDPEELNKFLELFKESDETPEPDEETEEEP